FHDLSGKINQDLLSLKETYGSESIASVQTELTTLVSSLKEDETRLLEEEDLLLKKQKEEIFSAERLVKDYSIASQNALRESEKLKDEAPLLEEKALALEASSGKLSEETQALTNTTQEKTI